MSETLPVSPEKAASSADAAKKDAAAFTVIPDDIAKDMPAATRRDFAQREQSIREWETRLAEAADYAKDQLKAAKNSPEAEELFKDSMRKIESARTRTDGLDHQKKVMLREEADYTDMTRRTYHVADRNKFERPEVAWNGNPFGGANNAYVSKPDEGEKIGKDASGKALVEYGANLVKNLTSGARNFIAAHEVWHTVQENQDLAKVDQKRAELQADEFAIRQPGITIEDAGEALSRGGNAAGSSTHPRSDERLENMRRVLREQEQLRAPAPKSSDAGQESGAPAGVPPAALASLKEISGNLRDHQQQGKKVDEVPTMASAAPGALGPDIRGLA